MIVIKKSVYEHLSEFLPVHSQHPMNLLVEIHFGEDLMILLCQKSLAAFLN